MDSHHGTIVCIDLLQMSSSVSAESDIFNVSCHSSLAVVWLVTEVGVWWDQMLSEDIPRN